MACCLFVPSRSRFRFVMWKLLTARWKSHAINSRKYNESLRTSETNKLSERNCIDLQSRWEEVESEREKYDFQVSIINWLWNFILFTLFALFYEVKRRQSVTVRLVSWVEFFALSCEKDFITETLRITSLSHIAAKDQRTFQLSLRMFAIVFEGLSFYFAAMDLNMFDNFSNFQFLNLLWELCNH